MWLLLGMLFLASGITYLWREIRFIKRNNEIYIISFSRLLYSCSCGFFGAMLCFMYALQGKELRLANLVIMDYSDKALYSLFIFWILSVAGYIALCVGYKIVGGKRIAFSPRLHRRLLTDTQIYMVALFCLAIGVAGLVIWTSDMGGILKYIKLASAIRGDYSNVYGNTHMAYRQVAKIILPTTYLFFFLAIKNDRSKRLYKLTFCVSFVCAMLYLLCNDGRLTTAMFFVILVIGKLRYGQNKEVNIQKQFVKLAILLLIAFVLLIKLDDITYFIRNQSVRISNTDSHTGVFETLMQEFAYIYKSGITAVEHCFPNGRLMMVDDMLFGISAYLPGGIHLGDYTQVSLLNTQLCTGNMNSLAGSIPCDIIALSLYDLSYLGVISIPFCVGITIRCIENSFKGKKHNPLEQTLYCGMMLTFFRLITYCEIYDFLTSIFPYIFLWVVAYFAGIVFNSRIRVADK